MNPIGAAASILTLVETTIATFKVIDRLICSYRHAPAELLSLKHELDGLCSQLILLKQIETHVSYTTLQVAEEEFSHLARFLRSTTQFYISIREFFTQQNLQNGKSGRVKWALSTSRKVAKWKQDVQHHNLDLAQIMVLLNVRLSIILQSDFREMRMLLENGRHHSLRIGTTRFRNFFWSRSTSGTAWIMLPFIKFSGAVSSTEEQHTSVYQISMRFQALFCLRVFCVELRILHPSLFTVHISTSGSGIKLKHLIPEDSEIMVACSQGDTSRVWKLLTSQQANVNDVTNKNHTPLMFAIESGCANLVSLLVNAGSSVKESFGDFQTSPLDWAISHRKLAITRLLLEKGADVNNINGRGWTPLFSLFTLGATRISQIESSEEYIEMLAAQSFSEFHVQDKKGWSCAHRAAAFGTASDIKLLTRLHAPLTLQTFKLSSPPIFCAAQFGNVETFLELTRLHLDFLLMTDVRMWTLLHVAVNIKSLQLIRLLINLGADPHARSMPTDYLVPEDLKNITVTPGDIALLRGPEVRLAYLEALKVNGHTAELLFDDSNGEEDLFWSAMDGQT